MIIVISSEYFTRIIGFFFKFIFLFLKIGFNYLELNINAVNQWNVKSDRKLYKGVLEAENNCFSYINNLLIKFKFRRVTPKQLNIFKKRYLK